MKKNLLPSRADVNDVFSTLDDGADGLVLAAETAIGRYPVQSAVMLSKIIRQQRASMESPHLPRVELDRAESCLLIDPHGGSLADSFHERSDPKSARKYPRLSVDVKTLTDAEQLAIGTYSPLAGFMSWEEMKSVLEDFKLPSGLVWPLPIVLQIHSDNARDLARSNAVALCLGDSNDAHAVVHIEDIYNYDLFKMARLMFGTANESHPGVRSLMKRGDWFVGGRVELLQRLPSPLKHFELTPRQTRAIFTGRGWTRIVGFHTRNIIHRAHEHIQMAALREQRCDGLFIRPVIGVKKQGDVEGAVIMKTYEAVVREHYPKAQVLLGSSQNYSRYAGPREAIFTALCHKNFGCTHFVVGRDHTGVGEYYGANDAHKAFADVGNIGIVPVLFDEIRYCMGCATYVVQCEREGHETMRISGTRARELLRTDALPPAWMMRSDVAQMVLDEKKQGTKVFV
tara:strand:- start:39 stop:1406 length:1368 start_codon:yes stop_codon:yes gene_type:complete